MERSRFMTIQIHSFYVHRGVLFGVFYNIPQLSKLPLRYSLPYCVLFLNSLYKGFVIGQQLAALVELCSCTHYIELVCECFYIIHNVRWCWSNFRQMVSWCQSLVLHSLCARQEMNRSYVLPAKQLRDLEAKTRGDKCLALWRFL